jgi:DNA-binding NtrC family response regulator
VPPLRERREDIPLLTNHFLQRWNREHYRTVEEVPPSVQRALALYPWPGNVRELENCVQKAVVLAPGGVFLDELLPPTVRGYAAQAAPPPPPLPAASDLEGALRRWAEREGPDLNRFLGMAERVLISWSLDHTKGVKLRAAKELGINRVTLDRKLVELDLHVQRGKGLVGPDGR